MSDLLEQVMASQIWQPFIRIKLLSPDHSSSLHALFPLSHTVNITLQLLTLTSEGDKDGAQTFPPSLLFSRKKGAHTGAHKTTRAGWSTHKQATSQCGVRAQQTRFYLVFFWLHEQFGCCDAGLVWRDLTLRKSKKYRKIQDQRLSTFSSLLIVWLNIF